MNLSSNDSFANVILDSISPDDIRLRSVHAHYPRIIHAELMTHRVFSRNARSSRACPTLTLLKEEPFVPTFLKAQRGMTGGAELDPEDQEACQAIWLYMAKVCREGVEEMSRLGAAKQHVNRPLEWFGYIDVLISSTEWANFFALRDDEGAQPEIEYLANLIMPALNASTPQLLLPGQWHLPYVKRDGDDYYRLNTDTDVWEGIPLATAKRVSAARCAGISYKPFDGNSSLQRELERYSSLVGSNLVHASPLEHQATPDERVWVSPRGINMGQEKVWRHPKEHGNFYGWRQFRKSVGNEAVHSYKGFER